MAAADYRLLTEATGQRMATALENIAEGGELEIADAYSSSATYAVGDYCIYNNTLYKCSTAITTAEAWTPAHWTATTVTAELKGKLGPGEVVNNLTSGGTTVPLSAEMGKKLSGFVSNVFYSNTTKDAIISTLNSLYGNVYVVFAALHSMTDGTKTGAYCIIRNTSMWTAVRFIYLDGIHLITTDVTVGTITIGSSGYVNIQSYKPSGTIAFVQVLDYDHGTGALSVDVGGNYLSGTPGNVTGLKLRYFMSV